MSQQPSQQEIIARQKAEDRRHRHALAEFAQRNGLRDLEKRNVCGCWIRGDRPRVNHVDMLRTGSCPIPSVRGEYGLRLFDHVEVFAQALSKPGGRVVLGFPYPGSLAGYGPSPAHQFQADPLEEARQLASQQAEDLATKNGLNWAVRAADHPHATYSPGHTLLVLVCSPDLDPARLLGEAGD